MIIGLVGLIGSGKNTAAQILASELPNSRFDSFAAPLKDAVSTIFGWDRELLEGTTQQSREWRETVNEWWASRLNIPGLTPRWILQNIGTEVFRENFHPDIWLASLESRYHNDPCHVLVSDARFRNELMLIKKLGGIVIEVKRGPDPEWKTHAVSAMTQDSKVDLDIMQTTYGYIHRSEWDWAGIVPDFLIQNDTTLEDMRHSLKTLISHIV